MEILLANRSGESKGLGKVKSIVREILKEESVTKGEVSVLLTTDTEIRDLNREYRFKDKATDVLSFPMEDVDLLGDIVISVDRTKDQASQYGVAFVEELSRLLVHGTLHLLGYDHVNGGRQARKMKLREEAIMATLKRNGIF